MKALAILALLAAVAAGVRAATAPADPRPDEVAAAPPPAPAGPAPVTGYVVARRRAAVAPSRPGKLVELLVEEGSLVTAGQTLARLDDGLPRADLARAEARLDEARREASRREKLLAAGVATGLELDGSRTSVAVCEAELAHARESVAQCSVRAPFAGVVVAKLADAGEQVGGTSPAVVTIVDPTSLEVEVDVPEASVRDLHPGQRARIEMDALAVRLEGSLRLVLGAADRKKATVPVRVAIDRAPAEVRPDMSARVVFGPEEPAPPSAPAVPPGSASAPAIKRRPPVGPLSFGAAALFIGTSLFTGRRRRRRLEGHHEEVPLDDEELYVISDDEIPCLGELPLVSVRGLEKSFVRGDETVHVLRGVDLDVAPGEFLALMGPSGSGKSTLLNVLAGIDRPTRGSVLVQGEDVTKLSEAALARWRARSVGYVFQLYNLIPVLTALENVELPLLLQALSPEERRARAEHALALVGLADRASHLPRELSGGQEQRVAIARAIVTDPAIIVADEPTGDLDAASAEQILDLLERLNREHGKTIVMVTHDPLAAARAGRTLRLAKGVLEGGAPERCAS